MSLSYLTCYAPIGSFSHWLKYFIFIFQAEEMFAMRDVTTTLVYKNH